MCLSSAEAWAYPIPPAHVRVASLSFWGSGYSRQRIEPGLRLGNRLHGVAREILAASFRTPPSSH